MESLPEVRSRSKVPAGLLGMLGLVLLIEACVGRWYPLQGYHVRLDWRLTASRAVREAVRSEVLCLGDSQVKLGVQPRVVESELGRPVTNLAIIGGQAPSSYFLLRRALRAGAKPKAVVVDFFPSLFNADLAFNTEQWPTLLALPEAVELFGAARDSSLFAQWAARRTIRSYDRRDRIRQNIMIALNGQHWGANMEGFALGRNTNVNRGALVGEQNPRNRDDITSLAAWQRPVPFDCQPVHALYVRKFLELASAHHIRVFWVLTPCIPSWQAETEQRDPEGQFERAVRQMAGSFPLVQVIDARHAGYRHDVFRDPTHLDHRGAYTFSADLAALMKHELQTELPADRWLVMPSYREQPRPIDLEDMAESRVLVRSVQDAIRR